MADMPKATATPSNRLLDPGNHTLILIDFQPQMAFATQSIDPVELRNNVAIVAKAAAGFKVATILTTVAEKSFSGPMFEEVTRVFSGAKIIDRTTMNAWEDTNVTANINRHGKRKIVFAGLWTSVCILEPALSAIEQGFDTYFIADACGDVSQEAHRSAITRMVQAGAQPMTAVQYLLELQRDWARVETYDLTTGIAKDHAGGYGLG